MFMPKFNNYIVNISSLMYLKNIFNIIVSLIAQLVVILMAANFTKNSYLSDLTTKFTQNNS